MLLIRSVCCVCFHVQSPFGCSDLSTCTCTCTCSDSAKVKMSPLRDGSQPVVALSFKLEAGRFGQLTYLRVYQGSLHRGSNLINTRTQKKVKVSRLVQMHSDKMEVHVGGCVR